MKNSIFTFGAIMTVILITSCSTRKRVGNQKLIENPIDQSIAIPDSTLEPGFDPDQRALAYFLMSLPKEEQEKWKSNGSFTEIEKDNFLNKIDSLQMDIQLPDPPNSITPDTLKK
jgi:hypothetical protein